VGFVVDTILGGEAHVIELDGASWLSRLPSSRVDQAWSALVAAAETISLPTPLSRFDALAADAAKELGPHMAEHFREQLRGRTQIEPAAEGGDARVLALGRSQTAEMLAILRRAPEPMRRDDIARLLGVGRVGRWPDEAILFGRGNVGLRQHFPDFDGWKARLLPDCIAIIREQGPDRQWNTTELLDELRETHDIPDWLTAYGLGALVQASDGLRYLGRNRVALPGSPDNESRIYVHEALEELIKEAGGPVLKSELLSKLAKRIGASEFALSQVFNRPQFVRTDPEHIGLLVRDVPGGAAAITEAADRVEGVLARRERGLSDFHVQAEVVSISSNHAGWTLPLTLSVLRSDGRFRFSTNGAVGLATWDSTRMPTRLELVRRALEEAGGRVSNDAVLARIEAHFGERPSRATVVAIAARISASVDGEWLVSRTGGGSCGDPEVDVP
jgi:hypothetical protein